LSATTTSATRVAVGGGARRGWLACLRSRSTTSSPTTAGASRPRGRGSSAAGWRCPSPYRSGAFGRAAWRASGGFVGGWGGAGSRSRPASRARPPPARARAAGRAGGEGPLLLLGCPRRDGEPCGRSTRRAVRDEGGVALRPDVHARPAAVGCRPHLWQYL